MRILRRIAKFYKVDIEQYVNDFKGVFSEYTDEEIVKVYEEIMLPKRATKGSAGYDFFAPVDFSLKPGETVKIPTGIRAWMEDGWVLKCYPRSGLGFKYRLQLDNTVGIIDGDYFNAKNQGHILVKLTNDSKENKTLTVAKGTGMCQGIFLEYGITVDDEANEERTGGFGSTTSLK